MEPSNTSLNIGSNVRKKTQPTKLIVINFLLFCLLSVLLIFVVPVFAAMFADFGAKLPLPTQMLINLSDFCKHWWWCLNPILGIFIAVFLIGSLKQRDPKKWLKPAAVFQVLVVVAFAIGMVLPIFQLGAVEGNLNKVEAASGNDQKK